MHFSFVCCLFSLGCFTNLTKLRLALMRSYQNAQGFARAALLLYAPKRRCSALPSLLAPLPVWVRFGSVRSFSGSFRFGSVRFGSSRFICNSVRFGSCYCVCMCVCRVCVCVFRFASVRFVFIFDAVGSYGPGRRGAEKWLCSTAS